MEKLYTILLDYYGNDLQALEDDYKANGAYGLVSGGSFAVYYDDQRDDLQACGYGVDNLDDDQVYELYCDIMVEALELFCTKQGGKDMKIREIYYTGERNSMGKLTYRKILEDGTQVFENMEDIFCDPEFDALVDGLEYPSAL